jgi:poly(3-hydroxybutyrate) depolymerase
VHGFFTFKKNYMKKKIYSSVFILVLQASMAFAGSFINGTMVHGGSTRKYVVYIPTIYTTQTIKVPLLVGLHGNGDVASNFSQICMSSIAF